MKDIALVGRMGSGKTTIANLLTVSHGYTRVSHADGIKEIASWAYGPIDKTAQYPVTRVSEVGGPSYIEELSGRQILQLLGQKVKEIDRDFWIKSTLLRAFKCATPVVNDDTRFVFEADALRAAHFTIVRVQTPDAIRLQRLAQAYGREPTAEEMAHESEREIDEIHADYEMSGVPEPWASVQQLIHDLGLDEPDNILLTRRGSAP